MIRFVTDLCGRQPRRAREAVLQVLHHGGGSWQRSWESPRGVDGAKVLPGCLRATVLEADLDPPLRDDSLCLPKGRRPLSGEETDEMQGLVANGT